jgi:predicted secreted protein
MVGAPGKEVWTFKAVKSGKTTINFKYVRPWEKDKAPTKTTSFQVVIKDGK